MQRNELSQANDSPLEALNKSFAFDWNDYRTIAPNESKVVAIEQALEKIIASQSSFNENDSRLIGELCFKLGAFYNHVKRDPEKAYVKHMIAKECLSGYELAWVENHLAFTWQQFMAHIPASTMASADPQAFEMKGKVLAHCFEALGSCLRPQGLERIKVIAFTYCVEALAEYEVEHLHDAIGYYRAALDLYEKHDLLDDQYARAKNRYAQFLAIQGNHAEARDTFESLEKYWSVNQDTLNPYSARFYMAYGDYLSKIQPVNALEKYKKACDILGKTEGGSQFTKSVIEKTRLLESQLNIAAFDLVLANLVKTLGDLPFEAREVVIESLSTTLLRGFVPISGMTVQQHISASSAQLDALNKLVRKNDAYRNGVDARYVYQFPREATSGGVIPAYIDNKTGDIYIALICNKRNIEMYNWSAGYTEAPLPAWRGALLSQSGHEIQYNRLKVKESATRTMEAVLNEADGDWAKVEYDPIRFRRQFKEDTVDLPESDINSFDTAARECLEEMHLDLMQFPDKKVFLISHDNTIGISQGDAPGQISNRSHQYLVLLGSFDLPPVIKPGDDVAMADWINVADISRKSPTAYYANNKPLCVYMLRGLELGLKNLWNFLLERTSCDRFSNPGNLLSEINRFCKINNISTQGSSIAHFMKSLSGELSLKTYTGKPAQQMLNAMLKMADYLMSEALRPDSFIKVTTEILLLVDQEVKLHEHQSSLFYVHQRPSSANHLEAQADSTVTMSLTKGST